MNELIFCQSCGMPLQKREDYGTETDGSSSNEYCSYCYQNGAFTKEMSLEQMIELNVGFIDEYNKHSEQVLTEDELRAQLKEWMPALKRWAQ